MKNFVEELRWRGMIHDIMPDTEKKLQEGMATAYVGIDPTADSLHIGHLVGVMGLKHFQLAGHKPLALVGGATGMIGDPSGKSEERNLLDENSLRHNQDCIAKQLAKFLDFDSQANNAAEIVNNYDWMKNFSFLEFIRDVGKHITVNYMMSKDSVKKRLTGEAREGMSFTEFTYQLVQGYDFLHLFRTKNCSFQMGGSDQWGNITTGTELIRRIGGGEAYAITWPLITKADGGKFGKTEKGNIWLDPEKTSPYTFYQFWLNCSDEDAKKYIRIFTLLSQEEIAKLEAEHEPAPHLRPIQKALAQDITVRVHGKENYEASVQASDILFGKGTTEALAQLDEAMLLNVFEGVPQTNISKETLASDVVTLLSTGLDGLVFKSKGEARKMIVAGGVSINKTKITEQQLGTDFVLLQDKYILVQKGKKDYFLITVQ